MYRRCKKQKNSEKDIQVVTITRHVKDYDVMKGKRQNFERTSNALSNSAGRVFYSLWWICVIDMSLRLVVKSVSELTLQQLSTN